MKSILSLVTLVMLANVSSAAMANTKMEDRVLSALGRETGRIATVTTDVSNAINPYLEVMSAILSDVGYGDSDGYISRRIAHNCAPLTVRCIAAQIY